MEPFLAAGCPGSTLLSGHYHENWLVERDGRRVVLRVPWSGAPVMDLKRLREPDVLAHLEVHAFPAPRVLAQAPASHERPWAVHSFVPGTLLHDLHPLNAPLPDWIADSCGATLRALHALEVPTPLAHACRDLARPPEARRFFRALLRFAEALHARHVPQLGRAFIALGIPPEPFAQVAPLGDALADAPFALCHLDAHRRNLHILDGRVVLMDWELALVADPAYELAVHLHRMRYAPPQEARLLHAYLRTWDEAVLEEWRARLAPYRRLEEARAAVGDLVRTAGYAAATGDRARRLALAEHYAGKLRRAWPLWHGASSRAPPTAGDVLAALRLP